jgi:uncharacterized membrane protein YagU involved in acid resistance
MADARTIGAGLARGVVAGVIGTAAMTAYQLAVAHRRGRPLRTPVPRTWAEAPAPAQVAKRAADALGKGRRVTKKQVPLLTNAMHWAYGVTWGAAYGLVASVVEPAPLRAGLALGGGIWAASYGELVPLGIYEPPWRYPARELALDLSYHLVYGVAVAGAYAALR